MKWADSGSIFIRIKPNLKYEGCRTELIQIEVVRFYFDFGLESIDNNPYIFVDL